jgi:DNA-binding CsgD family transcriptional regulator
VLDPAVSDRWDVARRSQEVALAARLTIRERQIVALVGEGRSNRAIADHLDVSVRTVEGHLNHVFAKVGVGGRTELVRFALTDGLVSSERPHPDL